MDGLRWEVSWSSSLSQLLIVRKKKSNRLFLRYQKNLTIADKGANCPITDLHTFFFFTSATCRLLQGTYFTPGSHNLIVRHTLVHSLKWQIARCLSPQLWFPLRKIKHNVTCQSISLNSGLVWFSSWLRWFELIYGTRQHFKCSNTLLPCNIIRKWEVMPWVATDIIISQSQFAN